MSFAVTHFLVPVILIDLIRDHIFKKHRRKLPNKYIFLAGIGGMLPDIDMVVWFALRFFLGDSVPDVHRTFTHTIFFPIALFALTFISYKYVKHKWCYKAAGMIAIGWTIHLILDVVVLGTIMPFYPLSELAIGLNPTLGNCDLDCRVLAGIDATMLILWLIHEEIEHKISDFL